VKPKNLHSFFGRGKAQHRLHDWRSNKVRSVTGAELRWVYRHRFNARVQRHIQFWLNDQPCHAPWHSLMVGVPGGGPKAWSRYKPEHLYSTSGDLSRADPR
jgi:hypothetical protein